ncbi:hypothetical protein LSM04_007561 [Trypanosoma melophagium]|uniref:uncharacterized protein n=1 Tax=Trypanosoma melophagium TaxID=715481 RepID=UPI00351A1658|nr:hypothetical protein LSM04_007561 [Trypanosoma melophagium]
MYEKHLYRAPLERRPREHGQPNPPSRPFRGTREPRPLLPERRNPNRQSGAAAGNAPLGPKGAPNKGARKKKETAWQREKNGEDDCGADAPLGQISRHLDVDYVDAATLI